MVTLEISAGAIFTLGVVTGIITGAIGLIIAAYIIVKRSNKER